MLFYKFLPKVTLSLLPGTLRMLGLGRLADESSGASGPCLPGAAGLRDRKPKLPHPEVAISVIRVRWGACARPSLLSEKYEAEKEFSGAKEHKDGWRRWSLGAVENRDAPDVSFEWHWAACTKGGRSALTQCSAGPAGSEWTASSSRVPVPSVAGVGGGGMPARVWRL